MVRRKKGDTSSGDHETESSRLTLTLFGFFSIYLFQKNKTWHNYKTGEFGPTLAHLVFCQIKKIFLPWFFSEIKIFKRIGTTCFTIFSSFIDTYIYLCLLKWNKTVISEIISLTINSFVDCNRSYSSNITGNIELAFYFEKWHFCDECNDRKYCHYRHDTIFSKSNFNNIINIVFKSILYKTFPLEINFKACNQ